MAQSKRIALSVPSEDDKILTEMSHLTNTPKTTIITSLIHDAMPAFQLVVDSLKASEEGRKELSYKTMAGFLEKAALDLNQANIEFDEMKGKKRGGK